MQELEGTGIDAEALQRFLDEQVYSLPGTDRHREAFSIVLTGSRAAGTHTPGSDVDLDVLCPEPVYESVQRASLDLGIIRSGRSFFFVLRDEGWRRYYGPGVGRPHFCVHPIEEVERQLRDYDDVALWIWTHGRVIADPGGQFRRVLGAFGGYPRDVLVRKIKYRWLLSAFWEIEAYPHKSHETDDLLAAASAMINAVNELLKLFFLLDGEPFPYHEKLMRFAPRTSLGAELCPMLQRVVDLVVGNVEPELGPWKRLGKAFEMLACSDASAACRRLEKACADAMIAAGVEPQWVEADFDNIGELLSGQLGPVP